MSFFKHLYQSYGPRFAPTFHFGSISWEQMDIISPFHIEKIYIGIVKHHFSHICTRVMALDLMPKFHFRSLSWEHIDRISPNFIYAFILTRSTFGLLQFILRTFVPVLWPLIYAKISFPFNILRTNGQNFTKFYICIHIDKIYVWIVAQHLLHICTRAMALDLRHNFVSIQYFSHICTRFMALNLLQNFFSAQCLENKWTDFDQTLYNYLYWQDQHMDC